MKFSTRWRCTRGSRTAPDSLDVATPEVGPSNPSPTPGHRNPPAIYRWPRPQLRAILRDGALCALLLLASMPLARSQDPHATLPEWTFEQPGDLQGWLPNGHLTEVGVTNGTLRCRAVGADPILEYRAPLSLPASSRHVVEIRLRADADGVAELFWSNTSTGRYGGFSQEKSVRFNVRGDDQWRTYRLLPGWHREGTIVRLRFDVYDGAQFELDALRVRDLAGEPRLDRREFDFQTGLEGWQWFVPIESERAAVAPTSGVISNAGVGFLLSPPVRIPAASHTFVSIQLAVDRGRHAILYFVTDAARGLQQLMFPIEPDGRKRTYHLDMLQAPAWGGQVLALGLRPSDDPEAVARLAGVRVSEAPQGPPELRVVALATDPALPRSGQPATVEALIGNVGAETARNVRAAIELPPGLVLVAGTAVQDLPPLAHDGEQRVSWQVQAESPLTGEVSVRTWADQIPPVRTSTQARFTARPLTGAATYVPEPQPVRGPYEVGVYYFPGWKTASQWEPLRRFPERKPVLGWYREGSPEVADWHIKWAVEHGITFFAYDWYWSRGARQLEHALHDGYFQARYRHLLKFCLLWANHNAPGSSSFEDCIEVTRYWIATYFQRPEYLRWNEKPVVVIFAPDRLTEDLGSDGTKRALEAMRQACREAGLGGLHVIACIGDAGGARRAAAEGYDAISAYNWAGLGLSGETLQGPFETLIEGYRRQWEHLREQGSLPLAPIPVSGGWDSRPWHGQNNLIRYGRTPALFQQHVRDAKALLESGRVPAGSPKAILIEAWNEWGEGSYIEPHAEFGFGYLDAIREVFTSASPPHTDLTPADVGRGPYDVAPADPAQTAWRFEDATGEAWMNTMDLTDLQVGNGRLSARATGRDPAFFGPEIRIAAAQVRVVTVRMRVTPAPTGVSGGEDLGQLFWRTTRVPEGESTSVRFRVIADGQWHEYRIPVAENPRWRGTVTRLRLDPGTQPDAQIEIRHIELQP